ncbi:hypothetical protein [Streptomyces sp. NPDC055105]|uniref:hypothetical protein n=1 Tax=Streptomyces sp. NPDC055105 TaxID=3365719 RepID=UPI0037D48EC6
MSRYVGVVVIARGAQEVMAPLARPAAAHLRHQDGYDFTGWLTRTDGSPAER